MHNIMEIVPHDGAGWRIDGNEFAARLLESWPEASISKPGAGSHRSFDLYENGESVANGHLDENGRVLAFDTVGPPGWFACWIRSLIPPEHEVRLWGDDGGWFWLLPSMTPAEIDAAGRSDERFDH